MGFQAREKNKDQGNFAFEGEQGAEHEWRGEDPGGAATTGTVLAFPGDTLAPPSNDRSKSEEAPFFDESAARKLRFLELRRELNEKERSLQHSHEQLPCSSGWAHLDALLEGGLLRAEVSVLSASVGAGKSSLAAGIVAELTAKKELCAWIDPGGTLNPHALLEFGVDLQHLLWVRASVDESEVRGGAGNSLSFSQLRKHGSALFDASRGGIQNGLQSSHQGSSRNRFQSGSLGSFRNSFQDGHQGSPRNSFQNSLQNSSRDSLQNSHQSSSLNSFRSPDRSGLQGSRQNAFLNGLQNSHQNSLQANLWGEPPRLDRGGEQIKQAAGQVGRSLKSDNANSAWAAHLLAKSGAFSLIVVDLADSRLSPANSARLVDAARSGKTAVLVLAEGHEAGGEGSGIFQAALKMKLSCSALPNAARKVGCESEVQGWPALGACVPQRRSPVQPAKTLNQRKRLSLALCASPSKLSHPAMPETSRFQQRFWLDVEHIRGFAPRAGAVCLETKETTFPSWSEHNARKAALLGNGGKKFAAWPLGRSNSAALQNSPYSKESSFYNRRQSRKEGRRDV